MALHVITKSWQALSHYGMNSLMWLWHSHNCGWWAVERQHSLERLEGLGYFPTSSLLNHGQTSCTKEYNGIESILWLHNTYTYDHFLCDLHARSVGKTGGMKAIPSDLSATHIKNPGIRTAATSALHTLAQTLTTNIRLTFMNTTC